METNESGKRMSKEERRKQILEAAMSVFIEKGFISTTTLEIAKAAGISEVTLFRYFSTKQEIFLEGIEPILLGTLKETINISTSLSPEKKLEYILTERICFISQNHKIVQLILKEAPHLNELGSGNFVERILQVIKKILCNNGIVLKNEEFALRQLMGSILSFLYLPDRNEENIKNYAARVTSLILKEMND